MLASVVFTPVLTGLLSVRYGGDLGMSAADVGLVTAWMWLVAAAASFGVARWLVRWGWRRTAVVGLLGTALSQAGLGLLNTTVWTFALWLTLAAVAHAVVANTSNLVIVDEVPLARRGFALGIKQAAAPLASALAGMSLPVLVALGGWRAPFVTAAAVSLAACLLCWGGRSRRPAVPRVAAEPVGRGAGRVPLDVSVWLVVTAVLGTMPVGAFMAYAPVTLIDSGLSFDTAAVVVGLASAATLVGRVGSGWLADRQGSDGFVASARLIALGVLGMLAMASGYAPVVVLATVATATAAWGWTALMLLGLLARSGGTAARLSGHFMAGSAAGCAVGPALFAGSVALFGLDLAWVVLAVATSPAVLGALACRSACERASATLERDRGPEGGMRAGQPGARAPKVCRRGP